jgi:hypothetical protein
MGGKIERAFGHCVVGLCRYRCVGEAQCPVVALIGPE